jgi:hypothetical protein
MSMDINIEINNLSLVFSFTFPYFNSYSAYFFQNKKASVFKRMLFYFEMSSINNFLFFPHHKPFAISQYPVFSSSSLHPLSFVIFPIDDH